jgi:hypothetical protein
MPTSKPNGIRMTKASVSTLGFLLLALGMGGRAAAASQVSSLLSDIERWGKLGKQTELTGSIIERIEKHATTVSAFTLKKLAEPGGSEETQIFYAMVLGFTKDTNAVPALTNLYLAAKSAKVKEGCFGALTLMGGDPAIQFLLATLEQESDKDRRFLLLNCLATTRHQSILPQTIEVLQCDPEKEYWRAVFVFGKMGDQAVPFLVERIHSANRNVRFNAINVLGQWLFAPEAIQPLRDRFWKEDDRSLEDLIFKSVGGMAPEKPNLEFMKEVAAKSQRKDLAKYAGEALTNWPKDRAQALSVKKRRKASAKSFQKEYALLYKSAGREGDYDALAMSSTLADEPALKKLRERILHRDSDEALYDYRKVSQVIGLNRLFADLK